MRGITASVAIGALLFFGAQSTGRAQLWSDRDLLVLDAARHFPNGRTAVFLQAKQAAAQGDAVTSVALLRRATELRGDQLHFDPAFRPIAHDPAFRDFARELAGRYIARVASWGRPMQRELSTLAVAHLERGDFQEAERVLEAAIRRGGIMKPQLESELNWVRQLRTQVR